MIGVLTHHWAKADKIDEARKLLDRNGDAQSKAPGFVSRQTLVAHSRTLRKSQPWSCGRPTTSTKPGGPARNERWR